MSPLTPSDVAAWYGAAIGTIVLIWDVIKWLSDGPSLRVKIQHTQGLELSIFISNTGNQPATIESVKLLCFSRFNFPFNHEINLGNSFGLSGNEGFPPLKLNPGEHWEANMGVRSRIPPITECWIKTVIIIQESHKTKPHHYDLNFDNFNKAIKEYNPPQPTPSEHRPWPWN